MMSNDTASGELLWTPSPERAASSNIAAYQRWLEAQLDRTFASYEELWQWSIDQPKVFWSSIWRYFDIKAAAPYTNVCSADPMPRTRWFEGARLNFVDQALRHELDTSALVWESETMGSGEMSWDELRDQVRRLSGTLRSMGIGEGDRVAAYLPNVPQTIVAFLAVASIGAIWSICAPEMGPVAVRDRFQQISPRLLIACDGYVFGGKRFDRTDVIQTLTAALPSVERVIWLPLLGGIGGAARPLGASHVMWDDALACSEPQYAKPVPFDHPLWIVYSSGTTGIPKAIVHGHGGMLLGGLVSTSLHSNFGDGHRVFWTVSTGWIVWNIHVMGLLSGATLLLYDGSATGNGDQADWGHLWRFVARQRAQTFGTGAAYVAQCVKNHVQPASCGDLGALEAFCSTGSPLSEDRYRWLYENVKSDLWICSLSGGTDIAGGFMVGLPTLPVHAGEIQCRNLGAAVFVFDEQGNSVVDQVGELVCTQPMPSMPLYFWGDTEGTRYFESYFDTYTLPEGSPVWRHGDWLRLIPRPHATGGIIYGRSDATINRGGIRMGTAELYRALEALPEVLDGLVVDLEYLGKPSYMALFVELAPGLRLDAALEQRMRGAIREALTPRHVPDEVHQIEAVPRNIAGKKLELPIKKLLLGEPASRVIHRDAMLNPDSIDWFIEFASRRAGQ